MLARVSYNIFIFISILTLPWYSYGLFILAGFFLFDHFVEGMLWGAMIDSVFGFKTSTWSAALLWQSYWFTLTGFTMYFVVNKVKEYSAWYD